ncbi:PLP-dependent transferase [Dothidotthia symphoricarpi CBS 119687]|uniref:PLP-dependent transferase n=1 Tax=Dothidotthia symphoricarpi CBS 119687 TaxID=1392245 RepID=A0A6A6ANB3_9PLEO|nr:PLP-dependent transferase [Dothidotthia symphoricarpi CBS 119687]KAF2132377.1 PLP-dependent transferase [Dothidotthia symphoricarpi CBS 119687]
MVKINDFAVESWMDAYETKCKYNIAETCCASVSLDQLRELSEDKDREIFDTSKVLNYGAIRGSDDLRNNLARLYSAKVTTPLSQDNIITTPGAIQANYLTAYALVGPGDHVICHYPTYQSLYEVPKQLGAEVDLWKASPHNEWAPTIEDLKALIKPNTKLIVINNPNNPTGAVLKKSFLQELIDVATEHNITIMSDEVYRPIFHSMSPLDKEFPPSLMSMGYSNIVVTGSMSKAYSLAGIRVGWIASRDSSLIEKIASARHYTTISVSAFDEQIAAYALHPSTIHKLLARNIQLAKANLALLEKFLIKNEDECEWVKPVAGTTAFIKFHRDGKPVDSVDFCKKLLEKTGVLFTPGSECFGSEWKGYVRVGFVNQTEIVKQGLEETTKFVRKFLDDVELAA